jgi:hypothetical protein
LSNNYFNYTIPTFNLESGQDWQDYKDIIDDWVDHYISKIIQLYNFRQPDKIPLIALELSLKLRGIKINTADPVNVKRFKYRNFNTSFKGKALGDIYLDIAESVTGIRGSITYSTEGLEWGTWEWSPGGDNEWGGLNASSIYNIFFNVKTTDEAELDIIYDLLMNRTYRPAFYQLILIDDDQNVLRVIE